MPDQRHISDITTMVSNSTDSFKPPQPHLPLSRSNVNPNDENSLVNNNSNPFEPHFMTSTSSSRAQVNPCERAANSSPLPAASLDTGVSKRKAWMRSASRHLGINNPKTRKSETSYTDQRASPVTSSSLRAIDICNSPRIRYIPIRNKGGIRIQVERPAEPRDMHQPAFASTQQRSLPPLRGSPDKPLPSLPIAAVVTKSPIHRRSLIDALEKPLRRSISPQPGSSSPEDWPALSPQRVASEGSTLDNTNTLKPSLGESVIEGLQRLKLGNDEDGASVARSRAAAPQTTSTIREPDTNNLENHSQDFAVECQSQPSSPETTPTLTLPGPWPTVAPVNVATKPKQPPKTSLPRLRHSKNSVMRTRFSTGSVEGLSMEKDNGKSLRESTDKRLSSSASGPDAKRVKLSVPGPIRYNSKSRHRASPRDSPYVLPNRLLAQANVKREVSPALTDLSTNDRSSSSAIVHDLSLSRPSVSTAIRQPKVITQTIGRSSIPLPSRLIRHLPDDSEGDIHVRQPSKKTVCRQQDPDDGDIDTDAEKSSFLSSLSVARKTLGPSSDDSIANVEADSKLLSFAEMMKSPAPNDQDQVYKSDSSAGSVRGYDEHGGFRVKKLRSGGKAGATLRVSDSAHWLLSANAKEEIDTTENDDASKRNGITQLYYPTILQKHVRRSTSLIKSNVQRTRSVNERSSGKMVNNPNILATDEACETQNLAEKDAAIAQNYQTLSVLPTSDDDTMIVKTTDCDPNNETSPSLGQGDWPLKDFKNLALTSEFLIAEPREQESGISSLLEKSGGEEPVQPKARAAVRDSCLPVSNNTPASQAKPPGLYSEKVQILASNSDENIANQTGSAQSFIIDNNTTPNGTFPPRTSSKQRVPPRVHVYKPLDPARDDEIMERSETDQSRQSYGPNVQNPTEPKHMESLSKSIREIDAGLDAVKSRTLSHKGSTNVGSGKKVMSNIRGLFHKKSSDVNRLTGSKLRRVTGSSELKSSPLLAKPRPFDDARLANRGFAPLYLDSLTPAPPTRRSKSTSESKRAASLVSPTLYPDYNNNTTTTTTTTPELLNTTNIAMRFLEIARAENPGPRQNQFVELGKLTVQIVQAAREAEKAREQAKQAAARAEMQGLASRRAVLEVAGVLEMVLGD